MLEELFQPCRIGNVEIRNRIAMAPMATLLADGVTGSVTQRLIDYYVERAAGGVGLIIIEAAQVRESQRDIGRIGTENPQSQVGLAELAEAIQEKGAKAFLQILFREDQASAKRPADYTIEEIQAVIASLCVAAERAQKAGFDGIEIHGVNFYFLPQFMSPLTNHRKDAYGGSEEGRLKLPIEIIHRVRERVGNDYPVTFRMIGHQYTPGGLELEHTKRIARRLEEAGASGLHIGAGSDSAKFWHTPPMAIPRGCHVPLAAEIKKVVGIPVMAVGRINDPVLANEVIRDGKTDFVIMGRALIADPELPHKAREGKLEDIRTCIACNHCHKRIIELRRTIRCAVNARAGRERDLRITPAAEPKKVMVIGAGPAGMEAARVSALRGHRVSLYEQADRMGGQLRLAVIPPHKEEIKNAVAYLTAQIQKLDVQVHLNTEPNGGIMDEEKPHAVIIACGAVPVVPSIPGWDIARIFTYEEALEGRRAMGNKVIVLGGGMVGCETAEHLASQGKKVRIVEKLPEIASRVEMHSKGLLLNRLSEMKIDIEVESEVVSAQDGKVRIRSREKGEFDVEADGIVAAMGAGMCRTPGFDLQGKPFQVFHIGDARESGDIATAIREGFLAAMQI